MPQAGAAAAWAARGACDPAATVPWPGGAFLAGCFASQARLHGPVSGRLPGCSWFPSHVMLACPCWGDTITSWANHVRGSSIVMHTAFWGLPACIKYVSGASLREALSPQLTLFQNDLQQLLGVWMAPGDGPSGRVGKHCEFHIFIYKHK